MNHHVLPPLGVVLLAGILLPHLLGRAHWTHQAPRLAVGVWGALAVTFTGGVALLMAQLILPKESSHQLLDLVESAVPWNGVAFHLRTRAGLLNLSTVETAAALAAAAVPLLPVSALARELLRSHRSRSRHAELLRLVGSPEPRLRATVLAHETPVVYCLPGRCSQVVVSSGALHTLTDAQLAAALAHERAHITGRHHLLVAAAEAFSTVFRGLPLARRVGSELPLLLEMAADDRALRRCSRDALATALYAMAAGQVPRAAFAAGGPSAVVRMRRILLPNRAGHPVLRGLLTVSGAVGAIAPLVMACCSIPG
ncbi:M56 family metallopeptidase [Streptomyces sp. A5-4]|uniref:M56 family metallopeptidase n=1 Tax=Streptomyces sp. A5-4 TaxID=3384771 RepID=UPI003DA88141